MNVGQLLNQAFTGLQEVTTFRSGFIMVGEFLMDKKEADQIVGKLLLEGFVLDKEEQGTLSVSRIFIIPGFEGIRFCVEHQMSKEDQKDVLRGKIDHLQYELSKLEKEDVGTITFGENIRKMNKGEVIA